MKTYEFTFLISPELSEQELQALEEKLTSVLAQVGGTVIEKSRPQRKHLSSPVQKKTQAFLWSFSCSLDPGSLQDLRQKLAQESQILRYTLLAKSPAILKRKPSREESFILARREEKGKVEIAQIEKKLEEILDQ